MKLLLHFAYFLPNLACLVRSDITAMLPVLDLKKAALATAICALSFISNISA